MFTTVIRTLLFEFFMKVASGLLFLTVLSSFVFADDGTTDAFAGDDGATVLINIFMFVIATTTTTTLAVGTSLVIGKGFAYVVGQGAFHLEDYPTVPRHTTRTISMYQEDYKTPGELICEAFRVTNDRKGHAALFSTWLGAEGKEEAIFTYEEVWTRAGIVAGKLRNKLETSEEDRVLRCYGFGLEEFVFPLACSRTGVVALPMYPRDLSKLDASLKKLRLIVEDCGATLCLADKQIMTIKNFRSMNPLNYSKWSKGLTGFCSQEVTKGRSFDDEMACQLRDQAFLQYPNWSTGNPKSVMISFVNIYHNVAKAMITSFDRTVSVARDDLVGVSWLAQDHDMGLMFGIMGPYLLGSRMYYLSILTFVADALMSLRTRSTCYKAHGSTTPISLRLCVRRWTALASKGRSTQLDLSSLQAIQIGAEPIFPDHVREFFTTFTACGLQAKLTASYGPAEHVVFVCCNAIALDNMVAHPSVDTLIGHGNLDLQHLRRGMMQRVDSNNEVGEIWLSSPSVAQGYWNMPQLSEETFRATLADDTTKATCSYLRTGDLGRICHGQLYVSVKDLIIIGGRNYCPQDIEDASREALKVVDGSSYDGALPMNLQQRVLLKVACEILSKAGYALYSHLVIQGFMMRKRRLPHGGAGRLAKRCRVDLLPLHVSVADRCSGMVPDHVSSPLDRRSDYTDCHQGCGARKPLLSDVDEVDGENRSKGLRPDSFTFTFADLNGGDQEHAEGLKEDEYDFTLDDCIHGSNRNGPQSRGGVPSWPFRGGFRTSPATVECEVKDDASCFGDDDDDDITSECYATEGTFASEETIRRGEERLRRFEEMVAQEERQRAAAAVFEARPMPFSSTQEFKVQRTLAEETAYGNALDRLRGIKVTSPSASSAADQAPSSLVRSSTSLTIFKKPPELFRRTTRRGEARAAKLAEKIEFEARMQAAEAVFHARPMPAASTQAFKPRRDGQGDRAFEEACNRLRGLPWKAPKKDGPASKAPWR